MPNQTEVYEDEQNLLRLYKELQTVVQSHRNSVAIERNKFDKQYNEKRSREAQEKFDIDFDSKFSNYDYHIQSLRRCREKIVVIDESLVAMLSSFTNSFFLLIDKDSNIRAHCEATRDSSLKIILSLDAITKDKSLFQVYEVFDSLRSLFTNLNNWDFVLEKTINDLGQAYNDIMGYE